jgi:CheY-like chemotaxis protein
MAIAPGGSAVMSKKSEGPKARYNLENAKVLLVEPNPHGMDILAQIFSGFGVRSPIRCSDANEAMMVVKKNELDLIICEAGLEGMDGYDFINWLRKSKIEPNSYTASIIVTGHTQMSKVQKARDCGANFIVAKPLTPKVMIERVIWVARENRPFIECESYNGPDRRFHSIGPPADTEGRRADDLSLEVGEAVDPNMSQEDIDAMLQPKRAAR